MSVYSFAGRGFNTMVSTAFEHDLLNSACTYCGQCADVCPTGAIVEKDDTDKVWDAINNPEKVVVVQTAPSVRVAWAKSWAFRQVRLLPAKWWRHCVI